MDGARLTRIGEQAWVADRELVYGSGLRLPSRMVVLQDTAGSLTLYAPTALDDGTIEALAGIGEVNQIIIPNRFNTLWAGRALDVYPSARLILPEADGGLGERFPHRLAELTDGLKLAGGPEVRRVRCRAGLDELVLYHDPEELLVVGDLFFNLHHGATAARWLHTLNGVWRRPAQSRLQKLTMVKDRPSLGRFYRWAMGKPFSRISMIHGQLIIADARETLYQLFHRYHDR